MRSSSADLHRARMFQCLHCNKRFNKKYRLTFHLTKYTKLYTCTLCNKSVFLLRSLRNHLGYHIQKRNICTLCNRSFTCLYNLKVHLLRHVLAESYPYACRKCHKIFLQERRFRCHQLAHLQKKFFQCETCGKTFYTKFAFQRHKLADCQLTHCSICNEDFLSNFAFRKHAFKKHIPNEPHECTECRKSFTSDRGLQHHRRIHCRRTTQYKCLDCNTSFKTLTYIKKHMKFHNGPSRKSSTSDRGLQRHRRIHCHKATQYKCLDCNKSFKTFSHMKRHLNSHIKLPGKPVLSLRCELCLKIFISRNGFENHKESHCNDKDTRRASKPPNQSKDTPMQKNADVYMSLSKENTNYGAYIQFNGYRRILPNTPHQKTTSSDEILQHQQPFLFSCPHCYDKKFEKLCDMKKHLCSHIKSSELISKHNTTRAASQSNQPLTSFNMHKGVHVNGYTPVTIESQQQDFRLQLNQKVLNKGNAKKRTFDQLHTCNVCSRGFVYKSDLRRHALVHAAEIAKITFQCPVCQKEFATKQRQGTHEQLSHYVCPICNSSFANRFRLFSHIDTHSEPTGVNQKLLEGATFSQTQWDITVRMLPTLSPYGCSMLAPRFTENIVPRKCILYNGFEECSHPMMNLKHVHAMPYNDHNGVADNREMLANQYILPQF
ncbi:zinc finger protein 62 [Biomphalaria pfeifferi]|uniref:Zinc finger protein 62 n=1 Tax=Biomphalaria pfeifferi TaxID=112525 RepID=A0AAD8ASX6_BIOPF|nr:zinc finger protein 62 [Biomphalaria pfeifferi]